MFFIILTKWRKVNSCQPAIVNIYTFISQALAQVAPEGKFY